MAPLHTDSLDLAPPGFRPVSLAAAPLSLELESSPQLPSSEPRNFFWLVPFLLPMPIKAMLRLVRKHLNNYFNYHFCVSIHIRPSFVFS